MLRSYFHVLIKSSSIFVTILATLQLFFVSVASCNSEKMPMATLVFSWTLKIVLGSLLLAGIVLLLGLTNKITSAIVAALSFIVFLIHLALIIYFRIPSYGESGSILYVFMLIYAMLSILHVMPLIQTKQ